MKIRTTWMALVFAALTLGLGACSKTPTVADVCEKLAPADEVADCTQELTRELAECTNQDDLLKCMGDAEGEDAAEQCFTQCERAEGSGS